MTATTLGQRNHNPLNIRKTGERWAGSVVTDDNSEFVKFTTNSYGYRAAFIILYNYIKKHRCMTIEDIISRWAPPTENIVENYVRFVSNRSNVPRREPIVFGEADKLQRIVAAMAEYESRITADEDSISEGYVLACQAKNYKLC